MSTPSRRLLALALAATLGFGACGGGNDSSERDAAATSTTSVASDGASPDADGTTTSGAGGDPSTTVASGSTASVPSSTAPGATGEEAGPGVIELTISGGDVEGGVRREKVKRGAQVTLRVTSDVADELHVHTYDLKVDLVPGQSADLTFLAKIPGVFEVELEARHKKVLELEVSA